jgi:hypothetical protein
MIVRPSAEDLRRDAAALDSAFLALLRMEKVYGRRPSTMYVRTRLVELAGHLKMLARQAEMQESKPPGFPAGYRASDPAAVGGTNDC